MGDRYLRFIALQLLGLLWLAVSGMAIVASNSFTISVILLVVNNIITGFVIYQLVRWIFRKDGRHES